ncbi:MAG: recombinase family protein [Rhodobacteraceae bacterium]|nr:recombinase family protein [Paracoccaceae bacterium]
MKIGCLRVSTEEQRPDRQIDSLMPLCDELHVEKLSACAKHRPIFEGILARLNNGDTLVVWDLDRAFRSTVDAIQQAERLRERGIEFQIVSLGVDTSTADGMLVYTVIAAMAEHERKRPSERTKQGLEAARRRGQRLGRPPKMTARQVNAAIKQIDVGGASVAEVAEMNDVHPWTLTRAMRRLDSELMQGFTFGKPSPDCNCLTILKIDETLFLSTQQMYPEFNGKCP